MDQPLDLTLPHRGQLGPDNLEMPVDRELGLRVEVLETARGEPDEVPPQQDLVLGRGEVLEHHFSGFENRALSCSMTFWSASLKTEVSGEARLGLAFDARDRLLALVRKILARNSIARPVSLDDQLTEAGLSSIEMVNLMLTIEAEFDIMIPASEITPTNFRSI
jgi:acyl carrier protein